MSKLSTSLFAAILCFVATTLFSQNVIWTEGFSGGAIPMGWTTTDASGQGFIWEYSNDPSIIFGSQPIFCSASLTNGFVMMDSDISGAALPQSHDARITTSAIDCSALSTVVVRFENQYGFSSSVSVPELGVSTDGTNFNYYPILTGVISDELTACVQVEEVDITADAAGQSTVYLQWRWVGNWEYIWRIDDISVQDGFTLIPSNSLVITDFHAISSAFNYPINNADTIRFVADIQNTGSATQTNVNLNVTVVNDATSAIEYNQDLAYGSIAPDSLAENQLFPMGFIPNDSQTGTYTITYTLSSDSTDINPMDNTATHIFAITDSTFSKDNGITTEIAPDSDNNYTYGTHYYVYDNINGSSDSYFFTTMEFGCFNIAEMTGQEVDIFLYKWDDIDGNLQVGLLNTELTIAALGSHTFTGNEIPNTFITVALEDFNNPGGVLALTPNTHYILVVQYSAPANNPTLDFFLSVTDEFNYTAANFVASESGVARIAELLDVGNTGDLNGGFIGSYTPALRLNIDHPTATNKVELPNNALKIFPSPATAYLNVDIELEELEENVTITLYDIKGQLVQTKQLSNVKQDRITFDVSEFAMGRYLVNITTDSRVKAKFFSVVR